MPYQLVGKDTSLDLPMTLDPRTPLGSQNVVVANRCNYGRVTSGKATVSKLAIRVATASGNIGVAVYDTTGTVDAAVPNARQQTTGAIACPAAGRAEVSLGASVEVDAGNWIGLSADNTTATFHAASQTVADLFDGLTTYQDTAHPPPVTAAPVAATGRSFFVLGAS